MERPTKRARRPFIAHPKGPMKATVTVKNPIPDEEKILRLEYRLRLLAKFERQQNEIQEVPGPCVTSIQSSVLRVPQKSHPEHKTSRSVSLGQKAALRGAVHAKISEGTKRSDTCASRPKIASVCRYFLNFGSCAKGDACAFYHPSDEDQGPCIKFLAGECSVNGCEKQHYWPNGWSKPMCRRWIDGMCLKEAKDCYYMHVMCAKTRSSKPGRCTGKSLKGPALMPDRGLASASPGSAVEAVAGKSDGAPVTSRQRPVDSNPTKTFERSPASNTVDAPVDVSKPIQRYWKEEVHLESLDGENSLQWYM